MNLLSDEENQLLMKKLAIEMATENIQYKFLVIPKIIDISDNIEFQKKLYNKLDSKIKKDIVKKRIKELRELIGNEQIVENEYYLMLWAEGTDEDKILKRIQEWINRFYICNFNANIINEKDIIKLIKSFTMPEIKTESSSYRQRI
ncbi:MAG: hypothetical protein HFJ34_06100 [Clostridia bacterium]|nr:hypothetical protein [Clostridia bacterium]